jgi:hypothetical protein
VTSSPDFGCPQHPALALDNARYVTHQERIARNEEHVSRFETPVPRARTFRTSQVSRGRRRDARRDRVAGPRCRVRGVALVQPATSRSRMRSSATARLRSVGLAAMPWALRLLPLRQLQLSSSDLARGPIPANRSSPVPAGTAAVGTTTAAMAAAVEKVEVLRTRLRAAAPSSSSAFGARQRCIQVHSRRTLRAAERGRSLRADGRLSRPQDGMRSRVPVWRILAWKPGRGYGNSVRMRRHGFASRAMQR